MQNAINWFELPAADFDRAVGFYENVLKVQLRKVNTDGLTNGLFPADRAGTGGAVVYGEGYRPSDQGAVVYLNAETEQNLETVIGRVEKAGGKVLMPKMDIGDPGYVAIILDSEGNKVGLHAPKK